jgi:hypothetical protein
MLTLSDHRLQSRASNSRRALVPNRLAAYACTLEAMRTQVCANHCMENGSLRSFRDLLTVPEATFPYTQLQTDAGKMLKT